MRNFSRRGSFKIINDEEYKQCFICEEYFPYNNKHFFPRAEGWVPSYCRVCHNAKRKARYEKNPLSYVLNNAFKTLRERNRKFSGNIDFDKDYLIELFYKQQGLCAISNLPMTFIVNKGKTNTNVSVDRIDSFKGYTKDNIQLVQAIVNVMKTNLDQNEFIKLCKIIVKSIIS